MIALGRQRTGRIRREGTRRVDRLVEIEHNRSGFVQLGGRFGIEKTTRFVRRGAARQITEDEKQLVAALGNRLQT